ncbi:MAG: asparaginase [Planctomycetota bacterium]
MPSRDNPGALLSEVTRSGRVESRHHGSLAVVHEGETVLALGDPDASIYARSAVKPLQALPLLESGIPERLSFGSKEIALCCASHGGTKAHVEVVRSILARGGLSEEDLGCGPHAPFDDEARRQMLREGGSPSRIHNNCSGKHAGFLLLAKRCGDDLRRYLSPDCRSQRLVAEAVAEMTGLGAPAPVGVDGCGAPTFFLPLVALARGFARLANPEGLPSVRRDACRSIRKAAGEQPVLLSGERRFCAALIRSMPGRIFAKNGAEGVYAAALAPDPARKRLPGGVGIAVKIADGNERGYWPVLVDLLRAIGCFSGRPDVPAALRDWHRVPVLDTNRNRVGEVRCAVSWRIP